MGKYNFNNFQIPHSGVPCEGADGDQQTRCADMRMSNFGDLSYNIRRSDDYTRFTMGFKNKDELQNPTVPYFTPTGNGGNWGNAVNNPYVWGSTTHRVRNEEFDIMTLGSRKSMEVSQPTFDVMDTHVVRNTTLSGLQGARTIPYNFPTEGFKDFGLRVAGPFNYRVSK